MYKTLIVYMWASAFWALPLVSYAAITGIIREGSCEAMIFVVAAALHYQGNKSDVKCAEYRLNNT